MALSNTHIISDLRKIGNDAFTHLYEVELVFDNGFADENDGKIFTMRCKGFSPPEISGGDRYTVNYITSFIDWPKAAVKVTRTFDLTFRVDSNYEAYKKLHSLMSSNFNPNADFVSANLDDIDPYTFTIKVKALTNASASGEDSDMITLFVFKNCMVTGVTPVAFTQGNGEPLTATATFVFGEMEDLQTTI